MDFGNKEVLPRFFVRSMLLVYDFWFAAQPSLTRQAGKMAANKKKAKRYWGVFSESVLKLILEKYFSIDIFFDKNSCFSLKTQKSKAVNAQDVLQHVGQHVGASFG